ncbi:MAG: hypothetical protein A2622_02025 [Bdellovibrionales bacterium RIFCSPHIGHO2_01_FULL_40_29]|nr:MAG: hypothetical protein A2622_02025 [Bdellovibrionales bacterium RIFCSPHIGHO2_01_FULL_40_29]OFZ33867.1 MAG: hypothetical protein A3D17_02445 [Bdellovibrionales bacterium RIFCSPHIGHO2_02_FULL_40_15]
MKRIILAIAACIGLSSIASADQWYGDRAYIRCNPDVQRAIYDRRVTSAYDHYMRYGQSENRVTDGRCSAYDAPYWFVEQCYLLRNPDVRSALRGGDFLSGWHHYRVHGQYENRAIECK